MFLLFRPRCLYCERRVSRGPLCETCAEFPELIDPRCLRCGDCLSENLDECGVCRGQKTAAEMIRSHYWLCEPARKVLHSVKYGGVYEYLTALRWRWDWPEISDSCPVLVPIPLHYRRFLTRGFNQAEMIAGVVARQTGFKICHGLEKRKATAPQSVLDRKARQKNLRQSFAWNKKIKIPETVLLIDDVYTTGTTLETAARCLKKAGVKRVFAFTLFRVIKSF